MSNLRTRGGQLLANRTDRQGNGKFQFTEVQLRSGGREIDVPISGRDLEIVARYRSADGRPVRNPTIAVAVYTSLGVLILQCQSDVAGAQFREIPAEGEIVLRMSKLALPAGRYVINLFGTTMGEAADWVPRASELTVAAGDFFGTGRTVSESVQSILVEHSWESREVDSPAIPDATEELRALGG